MTEDYPKHDYVMELTGLANECKWKLGDPIDANCPHSTEKRDHAKKIKDSIVDCVGNTPMVRINNITKTDGIECEILVKCEFMNPGGSVKDRIGRRMIVDAEKSGRIKKGDILIEPTSGNTGVGLSMCSAAKGYKMIITMPEKMSQEKQDALTGLGATVIRTPTSYAFDHKYSHIGIAIQLTKDLKNAHCLDQYKNPMNPMAHFEETGQEIWDQCEGKIDYVFLGAGTGGTLTGISRKLKSMDKNIQIIAIDPCGSLLAQPESFNDANPSAEGGQQIEGIGYDFIPRVLDRTHVDGWLKCPDKESYQWARRLLKEEGLMCGGSSGSAFWGAVEWIKKNKIGKGKRCVVLCPDNIRNYMTKHLSNDWMYERNYMTEEECASASLNEYVPNTDWGQDLTAGDLVNTLKLKEAVFLDAETPISDVVDKMLSSGFAQYPVREAGGKITGCAVKTELMKNLVKKRVTNDDPVSKITQRELRHVSLKTNLSELNRVLVRNRFVLVDRKYMVTSSDILRLVSGNKAVS